MGWGTKRKMDEAEDKKKGRQWIVEIRKEWLRLGGLLLSINMIGLKAQSLFDWEIIVSGSDFILALDISV